MEPDMADDAAIAAQEQGARESSARLAAVVVCYEPSIERLQACLLSLDAHPAVDIILVDNSESREAQQAVARIARTRSVEFIANGENLGVAEAQNQGLRRVHARGLPYVLLLDQDSRLSPADIDRLLGTLRELTLCGERVAAVGPSFIDARSGRTFPFLRTESGRVRRVAVDAKQDGSLASLDCDVLISSGSVLNMAAVTQIGGLDSDLFIDYVDYEWCLRARARGWRVMGVPSVSMTHELGDEVRSILGRPVVVHRPRRQYYLIRNGVLLARRRSLPRHWRMHLLGRALRQFVGHSLLCAPRATRFKWMLLGLVDGLFGNGGRCPQERPVAPLIAPERAAPARDAPTLQPGR